MPLARRLAKNPFKSQHAFARDNPSAEKIVFEYRVNRADRVFETYFFPVVISASVIMNADFHYARGGSVMAEARDFSRQFGLNGKPVLRDFNFGDVLPPEHLVAGLHILEFKAGGEIG